MIGWDGELVDPGQRSGALTALIRAVQGKNVTAAQLLIELGAPLDKLTTYSKQQCMAQKTALMMACQDAATYGTRESLVIAKMLLEAGAQIGVKDDRGRTVVDLCSFKDPNGAMFSSAWEMNHCMRQMWDTAEPVLALLAEYGAPHTVRPNYLSGPQPPRPPDHQLPKGYVSGRPFTAPDGACMLSKPTQKQEGWASMSIDQVLAQHTCPSSHNSTQ